MNTPIPHVIYFFWDRGKVLPDWAKKNIASWHLFFPDYLIREIDATNFDINSVKVVRLAYQQKRFSYACDYIRLKWIYDHGGIYFDLDVEVIKDMRDIVDKGAFFGFDGAPNGPFLINTGSGFGAPSGCPLLLELMKPYESWDKDSFLDERGFSNLPSCPLFNQPVFKAFGLKENDKFQTINGISFYPSAFFSPMNTKTREISVSSLTRSIHHYTWGGQPEIDQWINLYRARLALKNGGRDLSYSQFRFHLFLCHPFKALEYHSYHRKKRSR
jgi:hypothetical protein